MSQSYILYSSDGCHLCEEALAICLPLLAVNRITGDRQSNHRISTTEPHIIGSRTRGSTPEPEKIENRITEDRQLNHRKSTT